MVRGATGGGAGIRCQQAGENGAVDEVVTHAEVLRWLPRSIADELEMSLGPEMRGWYTEEEAARSEGRFVEVRSLSERRGRFLRTD